MGGSGQSVLGRRGSLRLDVIVNVGVNVVEMLARQLGEHDVHDGRVTLPSRKPSDLTVGGDSIAPFDFEFDHEKTTSLQGGLAVDAASPRGDVDEVTEVPELPLDIGLPLWFSSGSG